MKTSPLIVLAVSAALTPCMLAQPRLGAHGPRAGASISGWRGEAAPGPAPVNAQRHRTNSDYPFTAPDTVTQKSFTLGATPQLTVDNVTGDISVVADGGSQVRFTATEHVMGRSQQDVAQGQKDVHLDVTPSGDTLELYVDGPFRCGDGDHSSSRCGDHWGHWGWPHSEPGYEVEYSFEVHVPAGASVILKTVNGNVTASGFSGSYRVGSVNGAVDVEGLSGSGRASTVNGAVKVVYRDNPTNDCQFSTVNGRVSLYLRPSLNAAIHYSTVNGAIYTDFPTSEMVADTSSGSRNGMRVWRSGRSHTVEIGHGGPQLKVSTVNGDVFLHAEK